MNVTNKIILVTGAGSGIGKELVLNLLARGAKVAAADLRGASLDELRKTVGDNVNHFSTHVIDISDKKAVDGLPELVIAKHGSIDGLINCAGIIQPFVRINDLDYEAIDRVFKINFFGTLYMTKAFLPYLLKRPEAHIVNVSSMGGFLPVPGQSIYGASKAAIKLMTEGLYSELKDTNVRVSVIFPGATQTNISTNSGVSDLKIDKKDIASIKMLLPADVAQAIVNGIEKNKFQIFIGKDTKLMNLLYKISPVYATNLIAKQMKSLLPK